MSLRANDGGNMYMVARGRESGVYADGGFVDAGRYCHLRDERMYFVVYSGVLQVIEIGSDVKLSGIDCNRGQPVRLYNLNTDMSNYLGAIRGPVELSMASSVVIDGDERIHGYPPRESEALWQMTVVLRWSFPDYAAGGVDRQTGWVMVPYTLADSLAAWIALRAPAVRVEWRLPELVDLT
jgi:hypothetical protein